MDANQQNFLTADVSDPDNDILTYKWSADGGTFDNPNASKVLWSSPAFPETYHINLVISDGKGGKASFSKVLRVIDNSSQNEQNPNENNPPVINSIDLNSSDIELGVDYIVTCNAVDPDNDPLTYKWSVSGGIMNNPTNPTLTWTAPLKAGLWYITLEVSDGKGGSDSETKEVEVGDTFSIEPIVEIIDIKINSQHIYTNSKYQVYADVYNPDGVIKQFIFETSGGTLSNRSSNTVDWTTPNLPATYPFYLTVKDKDGNVLDVENVFFEVEESK